MFAAGAECTLPVSAKNPRDTDERRRGLIGGGCSGFTGSVARDWEQWHRLYDCPEFSLGQRLEAVRHDLRQALAQASGDDDGVIRLTVLCAGEGRDVLPVLADVGGGRPVRATLIEIDPPLADRARATATELGLCGVAVKTADAGTPETYRDIPRAHVLTVCGVFGNITVEDVRRTIAALPGLLAAYGIVIWTRGVQDCDRTPDIRATFAAHGFTELTFIGTADGSFRVGMHQLTTEPVAAPANASGARIFTFV
jgi:hypothetical protein